MTRKQRDAKNEKIQKARERYKLAEAAAEEPPGQASEYIGKLPRNHSGRVVLAVRVSTWSQKSHLAESENFLRDKIEASGGEVVEAVHHVGKGSEPDWLAKVAKLAKKFKAVIVAESTDRLIRSPYFHPVNNPKAQARLTDLEALRQVTKGIKLMTFVDPDASPSEVRGRQSIRGQQAKGKKGGRPVKAKPGYKKRRRERLSKQAIELKAKGFTQREIGEQLKVAQSTIQEWLAKRV